MPLKQDDRTNEHRYYDPGPPSETDENISTQIVDRLRTEQQLAKNGGHSILARSFELAIGEIERLHKALTTSIGYLMNAKIDLETGAPKRTAIRTIDGGLRNARSVADEKYPRQ